LNRTLNFITINPKLLQLTANMLFPDEVGKQ